MTAADNRRIAALASDRAVHRAFGWLHLHEPQLRRWQMEFLAVAAPPFGEAERAAWFCERFREIGLEGARLDAEGNAVAELRGAKAAEDGPVVLLSAHLDTVFPAGTDSRPREEEAKILGPGACDNGAGLAALLGLAAAARHAKIAPPCTILFAANVGEEGEGDLRGMRHLFSAESEYFDSDTVGDCAGGERECDGGGPGAGESETEGDDWRAGRTFVGGCGAREPDYGAGGGAGGAGKDTAAGEASDDAELRSDSWGDVGEFDSGVGYG